MNIKNAILFISVLFLPLLSNAQQFSKPAETSSSNVVNNNDGSIVLEEKKEKPVKMTPEQKAEIDISAMKDIKKSIKKQSVRNRRDFIDSLTHSEKILMRRKALLEGKSEDEVAKDEKKVEKPDVFLSSDRDMEEFLYKKANLSYDK